MMSGSSGRRQTIRSTMTRYHITRQSVIWTILSSFLASQYCWPSEGVPRLAVIPLQALNVLTPEDSLYLTQQFTQVTIASGRYQEVSPERISEALKGRDSSTCDELQCAIEIGRACEAEYIVFGSIGKAGSKYLVTSALVDVNSGSIVNETSTVSIDGTPASILEAVKSNAADLTKNTTKGTEAGKDTSIWSSPWTYIIGGAAVVGGGVAAFSIGGGGGGSGSGQDKYDIAGDWDTTILWNEGGTRNITITIRNDGTGVFDGDSDFTWQLDQRTFKTYFQQRDEGWCCDTKLFWDFNGDVYSNNQMEGTVHFTYYMYDRLHRETYGTWTARKRQ